MNKILIVGHESSGFKNVEELLNECGMEKALPSRREGLSAQAIGAALRKAKSASASLHGGTENGTLAMSISQGLQQIDVAPVWDGLAMDLMLANLDQPMWGWADPEAVQLLDYWQKQDPDIAFVLVYDNPVNLLTHCGSDKQEINPTVLRQRIDHWLSYHAALLHFFHRNADRTLLVHSQQVKLSARHYLQQVRARLNAPVHAPHELLDDEVKEGNDEHTATLGELDNCIPQSMVKERRVKAQNAAEVLPDFIANSILAHHPEVQTMWEELQSVANLPSQVETTRSADPLAAWCGWVDKQRKLVDLESALETTQAENSHQQKVFQRNLKFATDAKQGAELRISKLEELKISLEREKNENASESKLLLSQLHQVQEELERQYTEGVERQKQIEKLKKMEALADERKMLLEKVTAAKNELEKNAIRQKQDAQKIKKQLEGQINDSSELERKLESIEKQLKAAEQEKASEIEVRQENEMLLAQLHKLQEELERFYVENESIKKQVRPSPAPLYGAGQRVREQLPYRLGSVMLRRSKSVGGWVGMIPALMRETRTYKMQELTSQEAMPPVSSYRDAYDAENVRKHLSYRLGNTILTNAGNPIGWIKMPWALGREVREFKKRMQ